MGSFSALRFWLGLPRIESTITKKNGSEKWYRKNVSSSCSSVK